MTTHAGPTPERVGPAFARRERGLFAMDWAVIVYLAVTGILILVTRPAHSPTLLLIRASVFVVMVALARLPRPRNRFWLFLRLAYPVTFYGMFYAELSDLNTMFTSKRFDSIVVGWERAVFGTMPSVTLRDAWSWTPLSEFLHFAYVSYYAIPTFLLVMLLRGFRIDAIGETVTVVTVTFMTCYVFFIGFPVVGPFHYLTPPDPTSLGAVFPPLVHRILHAGSSPGTAFPSSHVAIATAVWIQAWRHDRPAALVLTVIVPALALGAVYGGFHYGIDALCGFVLALLVNPLGRRLWRLRPVVPTRPAA